MCFFNPPQPPEMPTVETPTTPEKTANAPIVGRKRTITKRTPGARLSGGTKAARRFGTRSLRIPNLTPGSGGSSNLNY